MGVENFAVEINVRKRKVTMSEGQPDDEQKHHHLLVAMGQKLERNEDNEPAERVGSKVDRATHVPAVGRHAMSIAVRARPSKQRSKARTLPCQPDASENDGGRLAGAPRPVEIVDVERTSVA